MLISIIASDSDTTSDTFGSVSANIFEVASVSIVRVRAFGVVPLCSGGTSVLTGKKCFTFPYLHVEQAYRNDVLHASSKVLRKYVVVYVEI